MENAPNIASVQRWGVSTKQLTTPKQVDAFWKDSPARDRKIICRSPLPMQTLNRITSLFHEICLCISAYIYIYSCICIHDTYGERERKSINAYPHDMHMQRCINAYVCTCLYICIYIYICISTRISCVKVQALVVGAAGLDRAPCRAGALIQARRQPLGGSYISPCGFFYN